jgi:phenylalanyl-tRNA synthetase beta chain
VLQRDAIERATRLLIDIAGGRPGPVVDAKEASHLPEPSAIRLRAERIERVIGMAIPAGEVAGGLRRLGMEVAEAEGGWSVTPPARRFDVAIEEDLIEEVVRLEGYDRVPAVEIEGTVRPGSDSESGVPVSRLRRVLVDRGYQEAVTYSFVDPALQSLLDPDVPPIRLANPISSELSVMRTHLWMGLCGALVRNVNRQERRVRLFETGLRFRRDPSLRNRIGDVDGWGDLGRDQVADIGQERCITAVAMGSADPEQWGTDARGIDFFDVKSDVEALLDLTGEPSRFSFTPLAHPALHPAQTAAIRDRDEPVGLLGALHPRVRRELGLPLPVFVFEIALAALSAARVPGYVPVSRFPSVRRDIAVVVDDEVGAGPLLDAVRRNAPATLNDSAVFDLYRGEGIDGGRKSVAIGLTFRSDSRTLDDAEVDGLVETIIARLEAEFGAELRR